MTQLQTALKSMSFDELLALANCINEALEAVDDFEFHARIGVDRAIVIDIQHAIHRELQSKTE